jgi:hypothetical protein
MNHRTRIILAAALTAATLLAGTAVAIASSNLHAAKPVVSGQAASVKVAVVKPANCPTVRAVAGTLPVLNSTAVVSGLISAPASVAPWTSTFQVPAGHAVTVYERDAGRLSPVGSLQESTPWESTPQPVVVFAGDRCGMVEILTPSRQKVPAPGSPAPAQTAGWVFKSSLTPGHPTPQEIRVSLASMTLSIIDTASGKVTNSWAIVAGAAADTPTPETVTYIESVYTDSRQAETAGTPILLTAAHSSLMPSFSGLNSGELGVHFFENEPAGASSHGCIRLPSAAAAEIVGRLATGTEIIIR